MSASEQKPAIIWPNPCHACRNTDGFREMAWHHYDRSGVHVVTEMMAACDCALGKAKSDRTHAENGKRIVGTVTEVWDRLAAIHETITIHLDPTVLQRLPPSAKLATESQAINYVRGLVGLPREAR